MLMFIIEMSSYQKFTKDIGNVGLANVLVVLKGIILLAILTKFLGVKNYGIWAQLMVTVGLMGPLVRLGFPYSLVRFLAAEKDKKEIQEGVYSVLIFILFIALIMSFFAILFADNIAEFLQSPPILIKILSFAILFEALIAVFFSVFQTFQEMNKYSYFMVFFVAAEVILIAAAILMGYGLYGAVIAFLAARIAIFILLFGYVVRKIGIKIPTFSKIKEYLNFGIPTVASGISYWIVTSSDRYLITIFLGIIYVGYYSPAYALGNILNFLIWPISFVLFPVISKFYDENNLNETKVYLKYSLKYFLLIAIPSVFGLSFLSRQLLEIFSTREIASNAYYIAPLIVSSILLYGISDIFSQILTLVKKTKIVGSIWGFSALLNLILNIVFIPKLGILGAGLSTLLVYISAFLLIWYFSFKELRFEIDWIFIQKSILASIIMTLLGVWLNPTGIIWVLSTILLCVIFYALLIFVFKGLDKKEVIFLRSLLKKA